MGITKSAESRRFTVFAVLAQPEARGRVDVDMVSGETWCYASVCLLIGTNPLVAMSGGNPGRTLTNALKRGLKLLVINPRRKAGDAASAAENGGRA